MIYRKELLVSAACPNGGEHARGVEIPCADPVPRKLKLESPKSGASIHETGQQVARRCGLAQDWRLLVVGYCSSVVKGQSSVAPYAMGLERSHEFPSPAGNQSRTTKSAEKKMLKNTERSHQVVENK